MKQRLKVLHVVHDLDYGGLERLVGAIVRLIDRARFESHILTLSGFGRFAQGLESVAELHRFKAIPRLSMLWPVGLARRIRAIAPDVVHTHCGVWYKASLAARHAGVPRLVHTEHGRHHPHSWGARFCDGVAARRTAVVGAVSDALRGPLARGGGRGRPPLRVVVDGGGTPRFLPRVVARGG